MSDGKTKARWVRANPEKVATYCRRYYRKNRDAMVARTMQYDAAHPEKRAERNQRFVAKNPTYFREYWHRRKLRVAWMKFTKACAQTRLFLAHLDRNERGV